METSKWEDRREVVAFFVAPLVVPLIMTAYVRDGLILVVATMAAYLITVLVAAPLYLLLRKLNVTAFVFAPACGGVIGTATMWWVCSMFSFDRPADVLAIGALTGAAVGTILWLIARPDLARTGGGAERAQ